VAFAEQISASVPKEKNPNDRELLVPLIQDGKLRDGLTGTAGVESARAHHVFAKKGLPSSALRLTKGDPAIPTKFV
jgi:nicotinate phosphoribosyltransferase